MCLESSRIEVRVIFVGIDSGISERESGWIVNYCPVGIVSLDRAIIGEGLLPRRSNLEKRNTLLSSRGDNGSGFDSSL